MSSAAVLSTNVFRYRTFVYFWLARIMTAVAWLTQGVTIGWQVYELARVNHSIEQSAFLVGMAGLVQFLPMFALALIGGEAADRYNRLKIILTCNLVLLLCAGGLAFLASLPAPPLVAIFAIASLTGVVRAFVSPATQSLTPMLVPRHVLPRAIAWNTLSFQFGMIIGPWLAGILCTHSAALAYGLSSLLFALGSVAIALIRVDAKPNHNGQSRAAMISEGLAYLGANKIVLGAISLDLFVVLLGGVTALLPVFARDILHIGAEGFGQLRSASAIGSGLMTLTLSFWPIQRHAGRWLFTATVVYGVMTMVFALSKDLWLSLTALAGLGAADSISVFIRQSLVQIVTPDPMRGRVSAVSSLFISASNELGEFESGVVARLIGPIGSAVFGGLGSILVTGLWAKLFPALRKANRLIEPEF